MRSVSGDNLFFHVSTTVEEETYILRRKVTLPPLILEKFAFSYGKCNIFFFHLFNTNLCTVPYYRRTRHLKTNT